MSYIFQHLYKYIHNDKVRKSVRGAYDCKTFVSLCCKDKKFTLHKQLLHNKVTQPKRILFTK